MSQTSIERMVMAKIYTAALYPNGQVDVQRDQYDVLLFSFISVDYCDLYLCRIFSGHIRTLAEQLDPNHQKLRIQKVCQRECPWPSAQAELRLINAYKVKHLTLILTCKDKHEYFHRPRVIKSHVYNGVYVLYKI